MSESSAMGTRAGAMDRLAEGAALWKLRVPGARESLSEAASDLVALGDERSSVVELASMYPDEAEERVERLVADAVEQFQLAESMAHDFDLVAARSFCRLVLAGELSERSLVRWAHVSFGHDSPSDLVDDLVVLDDWYDDLAARGRPLDELDMRTRNVARQIVFPS